MTDARHTFASEALTLSVDAAGAQLTSLHHAQYGELLWGAEPVWPQHAPNLFPIVGQLRDDTLRYQGERYPLKRHGFARDRTFAWGERSATACTLVLHDDAETRAHYPFAFRFEIRYVARAGTLSVEYTVTNPGNVALPVSLGAHPGFRWPLAPGIAKEAHVIEFAEAESAPLRRLHDGLLLPEAFPTPLIGSTLRLRDGLFEADALLFLGLADTSVRYAAPDAPGSPAIEVSWQGFRDLGIWSKPGAAFVCIEPWYGYASPVDFDRDFTAKPGLLHVAPGASETCTLRIEVL